MKRPPKTPDPHHPNRQPDRPSDPALDTRQRERLRARVLEAARHSSPEGTRTLRAAEAVWQHLEPRVESCLLHFDPATGERLYLLRLAAGGKLAPRPHGAREELLVIEGPCSVGGANLEAGAHAAGATGAGFGALSTDAGALVLVRSQPGRDGGEDDDLVQGMEWLHGALMSGVRPARFGKGEQARLRALVLGQASALRPQVAPQAEPASVSKRWEVLTDKVSICTLQQDTEAGQRSVVYRMLPGAELESHGHALPEECYVVSGELLIGNLRLAAGDFHFAGAATAHACSRAPQGALVWLRTAIAAVDHRAGQA